MGERRGMKALEIWCRRITKGYPGVRITNMTTSWRNGLGFCAIIHHFRPDLIDFDSLRPDDIYKNNALAFETAESSLSVPALLDPQDMVDYEVPDRLSILTYVSQFYQAFVGQQGVPRTEKDSDVAPPSPESASPSSEKHVATSVRQREPCSVCQLPVFLAERMLIERRLVHRTCFTCARCRSQLSTANYYITEDGQFCCEVCPDEEIGGRVEKTAAVLAHERAVLAGPADDPLSEDADAVLDREDTAAAEDAAGAARGRREDSSGSSDSESDSAESESESESAGGARRVRTDVAMNGVGHGDGATGRGAGAGAGAGGGASGVNGVSAEATVEGSVSAKDATSSAGADDIRGTDVEVSAGTARDTEAEKVTETVPAKNAIESQETVKTEAVEVGDSRTPPAPAPRSGSPRSTSSASASPSPSTAAASDADATGNRLSLVQQRLQQFKAAERPQPAPRKPARSSQQPATEGDATPPEETAAAAEAAGETASGGEGTERASPPAEAANPFGDDEGEEAEVEKEKEPEKKKEEDDSNPFGSDGEDETADTTKATNGTETDVDKSSQGADTPKDTTAMAADTPAPEYSTATAAATEAVRDSDSTKPTAAASVSVTVTEPTPPRPPAPPKEYNPFDDDEEEEGGDAEEKEQAAVTSEAPSASAKSEPAAAATAKAGSVPDEEEYPDDLNPFGDDEEESTSTSATAPAAAGGTKAAKPASLNPFGDSDEEEEDEVELRTPSSSTHSTPAKPASASREINPFEKPPRPPPPTLDRRKLASMRASVTPPRPPEPPGLVREQRAGSLTSLPGSSSKKKRPAPRPPGVDSPTSRSQGVSPALSPAHSPSTLRKRHAPPPPPPPIVASGTPPPTTAAAPAPEAVAAGADGEAPGSPERSKAAKEQDNYSKQGGNNITTNKSVHGQFKRRKGPAPLRPKPIKRQVRTLPPKETQTELHDISVRQLELERQGVELEKTIRQLTEQDDKSQKASPSPSLVVTATVTRPQPTDVEIILELDSTAPYGLDIEDMILQLFELVNEKNALFRRQAELMYMRRQHRLEEEHAELEYEIRCLMMKADALKTDMERQREQRLIERLVSVVEQRNEIVTMLEMERIREIQEDATIDHHMGLYAAERTGSVEPTPEKKKKKKKKKDKKEKEGSSKKKGRDDDKDIDEKEHVPEKKKSKKIKLKKLFS